MSIVVRRKDKIAILDSWLLEKRDFNGYISIKDAKELLRDLWEQVFETEFPGISVTTKPNI